MATVYKCPECEKEYKSRSGLRRHLKSKHDAVGLPPLPVPVKGDAEATPEDFGLVEVSAQVVEGLAAAGMEDATEALLVGCKALKIEPKNVLSFRVYHDPFKVVIIEGPVGQKRVWHGD